MPRLRSIHRKVGALFSPVSYSIAQESPNCPLAEAWLGSKRVPPWGREVGAQGQQGEVTQAALDAAILGMSANPNAVGMLDTVFPDPALEEIRAKINELILNGRR